MTDVLPIATTLPGGRYRTFDTSLSGSFPQVTMGGGTSFVTDIASMIALAAGETSEYLIVSAQVVAEYERKIAELQRTLLHYKQLVANLLSARGLHEELVDVYSTTPIDNDSIRIVDSIIRARVASSATFRDFDQEDF